MLLPVSPFRARNDLKALAPWTNVSAFVCLLCLLCTQSVYSFIKNWNHEICSLPRLTFFLILLEKSKHLFCFYSFLCSSHVSIFFRMVVVIWSVAILNRTVFLYLSIFHLLILLSRLICLISIRPLVLHRPLLGKLQRLQNISCVYYKQIWNKEKRDIMLQCVTLFKKIFLVHKTTLRRTLVVRNRKAMRIMSAAQKMCRHCRTSSSPLKK